ncbi:hypothetical protein RM530_12770 [Algiphilus sp. W345]|uniref:Uncharacterized protein n=1 Tax=Banduia mediterranea TaxID=3075609 RepID=A0ABU2WK45_9GAMM|nr:DUF6683 family protein [Algiphilus sp. W345]MDT0498232.1 hypothetical protein [Algiphilus sp. W345]
MTTPLFRNTSVSMFSVGLLLLASIAQAQAPSQSFFSAVAFGTNNALLSNGITNRSWINPATSPAKRSDLATQDGKYSSAEVLQYKPSSTVSQSVRTDLRTHLIRTNSSPEFQAEITKALSTDAIWQEFDRLLTSYGYSSRNLADVMAAYYVCGWEIVHKQEIQPQQFKAIRNQLAVTMANSPDIRRLSDAEKQRTAEAMGIMTAIAGAGSQELLKQRNQQGFAELQQAVYQSFSRQGIDLKQLKLTDDGFVMG